MGKDTIEMSQKEIKRVGIIQRTAEKKLRQVRAAELLKLCVRQVRRIVKRYRSGGEKGLVHLSRGKRSNRRHAEGLKAKVLKIFEKEYRDFGPTLAQEKLAERQKIRIGRETLRGWLMDAGLREKEKRARQHLEWRERKACYGEMQQYDGSHHDWLEGRGSKMVLNAYIDDATNRVCAQFDKYEGTLPAMSGFYRYVKRYGLPRSIYLDKHSTYKVNREATVGEQLNGEEPKSQFERALEELGVEVIHAHSPQAKGRIERLFQTFQDRVIKEMRLAGVKSLEEANQFLEKYLPIYNRRFGRVAREAGDLHRSVPAGVKLKQVLSIQTERTLRKDNTVRHEKRIYLLNERWRGARPAQVTMQERLDGELYIVEGDRELKYREVKESSRIVEPIRKQAPGKPWTPKEDHPWKANGSWQRLEKREMLAA